MERLTMVDGGSATLDLTKATIIHLHNPRFHDGIRTLEAWLFIDDKEKAQRQVLVVKHRTTLADRKPRWGSDSLKLTTIYGYDPEKNCWGPTERRSEMDIEWKNGKRLIDEIQDLALADFDAYRGGPHWYRRGALG